LGLLRRWGLVGGDYRFGVLGLEGFGCWGSGVLAWCSAVVVAVPVVGFAVVAVALRALAVPVTRSTIRAERRLVAVGRLVPTRTVGTCTFAAGAGAPGGVVVP